MDFGLHLGTRGAAGTPDGLQAIARCAEAAGLAWLGFNDHVIVGGAVASRYPYSDSGAWPAADTGECLEQLMTVAHVAAVTTRIRLLTSVMVLPHRPPVLAAKMLATADVLSKGRLTVGVGIGWMAEEMAALQSPPYARRAAASAEYIAAFRALWGEARPALRGRIRVVRRPVVRAEAGAEAVSADMGGGRRRGGAAARGDPGRRLVSGNRQSSPSAGYARSLRCGPGRCLPPRLRGRPRSGSARYCAFRSLVPSRRPPRTAFHRRGVRHCRGRARLPATPACVI